MGKRKDRRMFHFVCGPDLPKEDGRVQPHPDCKDDRIGTVVGRTIASGIRGMEWTPVWWDGEEDPDWFKTHLIVPYTPKWKASKKK